MKVLKPSEAEVVVGEDVAPKKADVVVVTSDDSLDELPKSAIRNADGSVTLPLRHPVTLSVKHPGRDVVEEVHAELVFHGMTGADLRAVASTSDEMRLAVLVARSTRLFTALMVKLFDKMDARDARDAAACAGFFMGSGAKSGR